ncbi:E3 ubiquitin protein ligase RIN3-like protein [Carex littledalei]|uniref:E3 ubiquitin protein ligase RIN3-like protein n=1 Tax=Carex littledalei TaxID=544730 RepID=A0A833RJD6_9POAL|nr:E3 ubiquitin protein ligase RIN3-like protein [Carex littledalei]
MEVNYLYCSVVSTIVSFVGLQWWSSSYLDRIKSDGLPLDKDWIGILLQSNFTLIFLVNFAVNVIFLVLLCLKSIFFQKLYESETRKVLERGVNYLIYKGAALPLVVPSNVLQLFLWSSWLIVVCSLKIFESLARDRLERLNASPSVTPLKYLRVYSALSLVLGADLLWMKLCLKIYKSYSSSLFLLLFFEPFSIAFQTLQAIMVYGFQLFEIWRQHLMDRGDDCFDLHRICKRLSVLSKGPGGILVSFLRVFGCKGSNQGGITDWLSKSSISEWRNYLVRNCGFLLDIAAFAMGLGHYLTICYLRGMSFHLVDAFLIMNMRALLSAIFKRVKAYVKLCRALSSLDGSLSDASYEEICEFNDECAICRGPMSRAKKLPCNHLFHLACLRSWMDQGFTEVYSCPTCRRPLFVVNPQRSASSTREEAPTRAALPGGMFPAVHQQNHSDGAWRGVGLDPGGVPPWSNPTIDSASSSSGDPFRPLGISGVQMMMRQLASSSSDGFPHSSVEPSGSSSTLRYDQNALGLRFRSNPSMLNRRSRSEILPMVARVREVLPHIPEELIIQDLLRTNNINITVNNLLVQ